MRGGRRTEIDQLGIVNGYRQEETKGIDSEGLDKAIVQ